MKARLTLAMTEQVAEDHWERHYDQIDVEVIIPNHSIFRMNDINRVFAESDIIGGQWLESEN